MPGVIHADFGEQNIIVKQQPDQEKVHPDARQYLLNGVIDFGDMVHSCYAFEIAIAISHMMIESHVLHPLDCGGHILAGYLTEMELSDQEWWVLKECVAGRFAAMTLTGYIFDHDPGNDAYMLQWASKAWERLEMLWKTPKEELYRRWKAIIESYKK